MIGSPHKGVIADRFMITNLAGSGGSGAVYRAFDILQQRPVAIKLLHHRGQASPNQERLLREARILSSLQHPGIVSYITHGQTADGSTYLALEWLDGEDVACRLRSGPLSIADCLLLLLHVSEALSLVHGRGITHRDLKPSNLFLRDGRVDQVTLLDFGHARERRDPAAAAPASRSRPATFSGTPGYLAPECAHGHRDITPAADIFSLGSVLYECLTGVPAFSGGNVTAVLAKIFFEELLPARQLRPDTPASLDALLLRMLAKDPLARLPDAAALHAELSSLGDEVLSAAAVPSARAALTAGEQRFVTVLLGEQPAPAEDDAAGAPELERQRLATLHEVLQGSGAQLEQLTDRALVVAFPQAVTAEALDTAERAVRSGLLIKEQWPTGAVAVATGRSQFPQRVPTGEALDKAARLLALAGQSADCPLLLDELTGQLVSSRFEVQQREAGVFTLAGHRDEVDGSQLLLGLPTPCVGREPELALLEETLRTCVEHRLARAVIVMAPSGCGKSRLRKEFSRRVRAKTPELTILLSRGDQMSTGLPFGLIGQTLQRVFLFHSRDPLADKQDKILRHLRERLPGADVQRLAEMLGEICGAPFAVAQSAPLRTARNDPRVLMEQVSRAWLDLLAAECRHRPVLLLIEDAHWADPLSAALLGAGLRELAEQPMLIIAFGRPEIESAFPQLWREYEPQRMRLGTLSRRACERLVRHILGAQASAEVAARIVEQSGGNALCLEELIRAAAEPKRTDSPPTVLLMLQGRLLRLQQEQRRVLRGASVFGEVFWRGGVEAMLGPDHPAAALDSILAELVHQELVERQADSRFPSEQEFRFRHCVVQEAALSLLTDSDLTLGHRIAAGYLESVGERDPLVLAEHFHKGGEPQRALPHYLAACERALRGCDLEGALSRAELAMACGPQGELLGKLHNLRLAAYFWADRWAEAFPEGAAALLLLPPGSVGWCRAAAIMAPITTLIGRNAEFALLAQQLATVTPDSEALEAYLQATAYAVNMFSLTGQLKLAGEFRELCRHHSRALSAPDLAIVGVVLFAETVYERMLGRDPLRSWQLSSQGAAISERAADQRNLLFIKAFEGIGLAELGDRAGAWSVLQSAAELATRLREPLLLTHVRIHIEQLQLTSGTQADIEAAYHSAQQSVTSAGINPLLHGQSLINLARAQLLLGEHASALETGRKAAALLSATPAHLIFLNTVIIECLLAQGRPSEAAAEAKRGLASIAELGIGGYGEVGFLRAAALALHAAGELEAARSTLAEGQRQIRLRAEKMTDREVRSRYLTGVAENRMLLSLAL